MKRRQYQQNQHRYVCGRQADGTPCPVGPDGKGQCGAAAVCQPWFDGQGWHCTRAKAFGGRCSEGPIPDPECPTERAVCPHQCGPCQPVRSLRSTRRLVSGLTAAAAFGLCLLLLGGTAPDAADTMVSTRSLVSPGPLSAHHATMQQGCSACHTAADRSPLQILNCLVEDSGGIEESYRCLKCHQEFGQHALHPHSVDPQRLRPATERSLAGGHTPLLQLARMLAEPETTPTGEMACATCHREHQGTEFDLTAMTNAQCQSCHSSSFHSFDQDHPEFPERQRARIRFDHVTHMQLHFQAFERTMPHGQARMQCSDCHTPDASGHMMQLASFEHMCASCHTPQIQDHKSAADLRLHDWVFLQPPAAGETDPITVPFMDLMLGEQATQPAAVTSLLADLTEDGRDAVRRRLHMICDEHTQASTIEACLTALEDSHFFEIVAAWADSPEAESPPQIQHGNWHVRGPDPKLVYECTTHADPLLKTWIDLLARNASQYPHPPAAGADGHFDRFLRDIIAPESTGRCLKCHSIERDDRGRLQVHWNSLHGKRSVNDFTFFSHQPHLTLLSGEPRDHTAARDQRCQTCHALDSSSFRLGETDFHLADGMPTEPAGRCSAVGVQSTQRHSCAECHTSTLAGDNCLQCHNYHVHERTQLPGDRP